MWICSLEKDLFNQNGTFFDQKLFQSRKIPIQNYSIPIRENLTKNENFLNPKNPYLVALVIRALPQLKRTLGSCELVTNNRQHSATFLHMYAPPTTKRLLLAKALD
jgi:hypothetical protein